MYDTEAAQLRAAYYRYYNEINGTRYGVTDYPLYDGGVDHYGRRHKPVWPKILKTLRSLDIDILLYLEDIFSRHRIDRPQDLVKKPILEDYLARAESPVVLRRWDAEESAINSRIRFRVALGDSLERAAEIVLLDISSEVSPLVRYVFARKAFPSIDMGDSVREAAKKQYLDHWRAYNKFCYDRIPEEWRK